MILHYCKEGNMRELFLDITVLDEADIYIISADKNTTIENILALYCQAAKKVWLLKISLQMTFGH